MARLDLDEKLRRVRDRNFGVELSWKDALSRPSSWLLRQVAEFKVVVLRVPPPGLSVEDFVRTMEGLGKSSEHPLDNFTLPNWRNVLVLSNLYRDGVPLGVHDGGTYWHTDMAYKQENCVLTGLYSVQIPRGVRVSATEFVDCEVHDSDLENLLSWDRESAEVGAAPEACSVLHQFGNRERKRNKTAARQILSARQLSELRSGVLHPLVLVHPITGRKSLYAVAATSIRIGKLSVRASQSKLDCLLDALLKRETFTHVYSPGDLVIWDNLSTLHRGKHIPATDDPSDCRVLYRMNVDYSHHSASARETAPEIWSTQTRTHQRPRARAFGGPSDPNNGQAT